MSSGHPPNSDSGTVQDDESTINAHNDANACFFQDFAGLNAQAAFISVLPELQVLHKPTLQLIFRRLRLDLHHLTKVVCALVWL